MVEKVEKIWFEGKLIDWDKAQIHVCTHALHYGMGVFEGIRFYKCQDGRSAVFRLKEHIDRLFESALICSMTMPYSRQEIVQASLETARVSKLENGYIRPLAFLGMGAMGVYPASNPVVTTVIVWPWGTYLGHDALDKGISTKISSFTRHHVNVGMTKAKVSGQYINSTLAKKEAKENGYDEAILLDTEGYVSEASGENIFIVKHGRIKTTSLTSILSGITRDTLINIAKDNGYEISEQKFTRDEMYAADEVFLCGTAAEVTPIREIDKRKVGDGKPGPVTLDIQKTYFETVRGKIEKYRKWLTYIEK